MGPDLALRRRERRRLLVAMLATVVAVPLLLVEVAPGADASPDSSPAALVIDLDTLPDRFDVGVADPSADHPRAVGSLTGDELAAPRALAALSNGDALRAEATAAAEEAERQRQAEAAEEAERQRQAEADAEAARRAAEEQARLAEEQRRAEEEAARQRDAEQTTSAPSISMPAGTTAQQWHQLRMCESSNNYGAVNPRGPYLGAYQFLQSTWDGTARYAGRTDLVGVRPNQAAPADQDSMAYALYNQQGSTPWPKCGVYLP